MCKRITAILIFIFLSPNIVFAKYNMDRVNSLPGLGKLKSTQYSGYANGIFYWYIQSIKNYKNKPIIIWTSGGPGTSSLYGLFKENGPYQCAINKMNKPIFSRTRDHADWSSFSNYLVFDQPLGVGLSFSPKRDFPRSPIDGNAQYYKALKSFFKKHPELKKHDIYLAGESYGGTYMALLANSILNDKSNNLKFKGVIIISGWVAPKLQYKSMPYFAYNHGLIDKIEFNNSQSLYKACYTCDNQKRDCYKVCNKVDNYISDISGMSLHDIANNNSDLNWRKGGWINCLNSNITRISIHANMEGVYKPMTNIWDLYGKLQLNSVLPIYKKIIANNLKLLVISGLNDGSPSGYLGSSLWLRTLHKNNNNLKQEKWLVDKKLLGYKIKVSSQILWVKVLHSGHTVPTYQPLISNLVKSFVD
jgi:pimeloyl-ACP methyl ester carboxylesterase